MMAWHEEVVRQKYIGEGRKLELADIYIYADDEDSNTVYFLIGGPAGTPYEGGVYCFKVNPSDTYPYEPPRVHFFHLGKSPKRINPNLYVTGKVCLSILGTWHGPGWMPSINLESLATTIQSILVDEPLRNEPGYEKVETSRCQSYNARVVKIVRQDFIGHLPPCIKNPKALAFAQKIWATRMEVEGGSKAEESGKKIGDDAFYYLDQEKKSRFFLIAGPSDTSYVGGVFCFKLAQCDLEHLHFSYMGRKDVSVHPFLPSDGEVPLSCFDIEPRCLALGMYEEVVKGLHSFFDMEVEEKNTSATAKIVAEHYGKALPDIIQNEGALAFAKEVWARRSNKKRR